MAEAGQTEVRVSTLQSYLPHRPPAVWLDTVVEYGENGGECRVNLLPEARYASGGWVRATSYVEWVAQAYGYSVAAWFHIRGNAPELKRAYLVSISNLKLADTALNVAAQKGEELYVRAHRTHQLGPIAVVSGEVSTRTGVLLASMRLKVFADEA